MENKNNF